jgi:biliverdin reductase
MDQIKLGIIGSGGMSTRRAKVFKSLPDTVVKVIAARNPTTGPKLANEVSAECVEDWRSLLDMDDLDAVFVGTHNEIHGPIVIESIEAGKHVLTEYPTSRTHDEGIRIASLISSEVSPVLRVSNNESISAEHAALKQQVSGLGPLYTSHFVRLTPGRGKRPEVLFNLDLSGPPALFFVYHIHTYVSLFGPADWVHCSAHYEGINEDTGYERFSTVLTVGFASGGTGHWTWAGGIAIETASQEARIVTRDATLIETDAGWDISTPTSTFPMMFGEDERSLEQLFVADVCGETEWRADAQIALDAATIGHAAEMSAREKRVVRVAEL